MEGDLLSRPYTELSISVLAMKYPTQSDGLVYHLVRMLTHKRPLVVNVVIRTALSDYSSTHR